MGSALIFSISSTKVLCIVDGKLHFILMQFDVRTSWMCIRLGC